MRRLLGFVAVCASLLLIAPSALAQVMEWGLGTEVPTAVGGTEGAMLIDAGNANGFAIGPGGVLLAAGLGKAGALGNGSTRDSEVAVQVLLPIGSVTVAIGEDERSGFAVLSTGHVYAWGLNKQGDLCLGNVAENQPVPMEIPGLSEVVEAAGAKHHILFRLANGTVKACGYNNVGELGIEGAKMVATPQLVPGLEHVVELSAGPQVSFARTASGELLGFGANTSGQLGLGPKVNKAQTPTRVPLPGPVSEVSAGGGNELAHTFALVGGIPYCWGIDEAGECGDGSEAPKYSPTIATELTGLKLASVHAAGQSSVVLTTGGNVYTFGEDMHGELGDGGGPATLTPVLVDTGAVEISATAPDILDRH